MKKRLLVLTIIISAATFSFAQDYTTGIGLRGGFSQGITVKHFISDVSAFEGLLSTKYRGFDVTALYELHRYDVFGKDRLNWYYGAGAHLGLWNEANTTWATEKQPTPPPSSGRNISSRPTLAHSMISNWILTD